MKKQKNLKEREKTYAKDSSNLARHKTPFEATPWEARKRCNSTCTALIYTGLLGDWCE